MCGRGAKLALNSIGPVNELTENISSSVKSVSAKTSIMAKRRLLALVVLLGIAVIGIWRLAELRPCRQSCPLPDGSELSLAKVTFGKKHEFRYDGPLQRLVNWLRLPLVPPRVHIATLTSADTNGLVIWLWRHGGQW